MNHYDSNQSSTNEDQLKQLRAGGSLPPRSLKHGRKRGSPKKKDVQDEQNVKSDEEVEEKRSFPLIQIILYTFLAIIVAFLIFWFWQYNQNKANETMTDPLDPFERFKQEARPGPEEGEPNHSSSQDRETNDSQDGEGQDQATSDHDTTQKELDGAAKEGQTDPQDATEPKIVDQEEQNTEEKQDQARLIAEHRIKEDENLFRITMQYYGSREYEKALAAYNGIEDTQTVYAGTVLQIPEVAVLKEMMDE